MVDVIDTDLVPAHKRADYLQAAAERSVLPLVDFSLSRFRDSDFRARFSGRRFGDAFIARFSANALHLARAARHISERSCDTVLLALLHRGTYEQSFGYRPPFPRAGPGDFLLIDLDAPQSVVFAQSAVTTCAYLPRAIFAPYIDGDTMLNPVLFRRRDELYGLLSACFHACIAMREPTPAAATGALSTLAHLSLIARGLHHEEDGELGMSLAQARRLQAQQFITAHCDDPRLDAQMIADNLGLSLRSLHLAFEETGQGVAARTMAARLARAREMLVCSPDRSTLDVAMACGFNNLSTFYRGFAEAYGIPPGAFRRARRRSIAEVEIEARGRPHR